MSRRQKYFEDYMRLFPKELHPTFKSKLDFKDILEKDGGLKVPLWVWLAFLTPTDSKGETLLLQDKYKHVEQLKIAMLKTFKHPRQFLNMRNPLHQSNDRITLALLEILYDLGKQKVLLRQNRYYEWIEVAEHFGLWKLRYALEDAVFKTFDPENFALFESVVKRQMFMESHLALAVRGIVENALKHGKIKKFGIENRRKNIYGVYKKVALKKKNINEIYDIHGFRILTSSEKDCREVVNVLHRLWRHFPERYKDYIAKPKKNGYQSIHTVLCSLEKKLVEFQVRTYEMDQIAESGPANHAEYKKTLQKITSS